MTKTTVYHANGATFNCDTQERLDAYLKAGWTTKPQKKTASEAEKKTEGKEA